MSCHRRITQSWCSLTPCKKELGAVSQCDWRWGGSLLFSFQLPDTQRKPTRQPQSSACAHELYMGSIKTLNSWFLRNLPATTAARLSLCACLLKQQHLWLRLCGNVHFDHQKPASHRAIFSSISSLWRATGPAADFLTWLRDALQ